MSPKHRGKQFAIAQYGAATLIVTLMLLVAAALMIIYSAQHSMLQQRSSSNQLASAQAFQAAEAGFEVGISYLRQNVTTITANPSGGYINYGPSDANITNVTLANSSKYSIVYTNPTASNYQLIRITSTGTSPDGLATRSVSQRVQYKPLLINTPTGPSTVLGSASLKGSADIENNEGNTTVIAGSSISYQGSASSTSQNSTSNKNTTGTDIKPNDATLSGMSADTFFQTYFGTSVANVKNSTTYYYSGASVPSLNGITNASIWIEGDYTNSGGDTIGSTSAPVIMIVNGNFTLNGGTTIYGFVFVYGTFSTQSGTPNIIGGFATSGNLDLGGSPIISYSSSVLTIATNTTGNFAKVPGTWRDF